jgi:hypothetical protein
MQRRPLQKKSASLVPNFAARWHSFCEYFLASEINIKMKQTTAPKVYIINPFTPLKEDSNNGKSRSKATKSQNHLKEEQKTNTSSL